ncbi:MAG: hypothetical protein HY563_02070 [Ignavibacteriales bacterium]|nr:hypothetical protein [Ignavibacteriales bacterium]
MKKIGAIGCGMIFVIITSQAQIPRTWTVDGGLTFSHFQQQVKAEVGDPRGERLVNELQFGVMALGAWKIWDYASIGAFMQYDRGNRHAARFNGFDPANGKTVTVDKIGGNYRELWAGPFVRVQWKNLFGEFGYGLFGFRDDEARTDLKSSAGDSTGSFSLNPSIAWYAALGGAVALWDAWDLVIRMEYRLRYYNKREGNSFQSNIEHGTQNITPYIGLRWQF